MYNTQHINGRLAYFLKKQVNQITEGRVFDDDDSHELNIYKLKPRTEQQQQSTQSTQSNQNNITNKQIIQILRHCQKETNDINLEIDILLAIKSITDQTINKQ